MKKVYLFVLSLCCTVTLFAQQYSYVPFPLAATRWTERSGNNDVTPPSFYCYGLTTTDTTINAVVYRKLYRSDDTTLTENEYFGGIREENKRIYLLTNGPEKLLYDFNLNVGDTAHINNGLSSAGGVVNQIDTVLIAGTLRKRFSFTLFGGANMPWAGSWIEGIGNSGLGGLVASFAIQPTCDCGPNLLCVNVDQNWIYHNPQYSSLDCVSSGTAINSPVLKQAVALVAPNPVSGISRLVIESKAKFDRIDVYDCRGVQVKTYKVTGSSQLLIDQKEYVPGFYSYRLSGAGQAIGTGKFSVQ